jgi:hypothetical protein
VRVDHEPVGPLDGRDLDLGKLDGAASRHIEASRSSGDRRTDQEVTCFINNLGLGRQFAAAAAVVYRKAKESGVGRDLPTEWFTQDVHPQALAD